MEIRNFCIIAHIDHGKSTLADRFLEVTGTLKKREMREQTLDMMDLERERGITIKLTPVRMSYQGIQLNLIDTPGHTDFRYEVSRSLVACEGVILLVDASQGIQAQTLAVLTMAMEHDLTIIPVLNKIDLPSADTERVSEEGRRMLGCKKEDILLICAKDGRGVEELLRAVIERIPSTQPLTLPSSNERGASSRALIFDAVMDTYRGVVAYVRIFDGSFRKGQEVFLLGAKGRFEVQDVGHFSPKYIADDELPAGSIGYVVTGAKDVGLVRVGDTIADQATAHPLPGYKHVQPMVFAGLYPSEADGYHDLRDALEKLALNDAALQIEHERNAALGNGFRCGFLGLLHMDIIQERLEREYDCDLVITAPSVLYEVKLSVRQPASVVRSSLLKSDEPDVAQISNPAAFPDASCIAEVREPWVALEIVCRSEDVGAVMTLTQERRGTYFGLEYLDAGRALLKFEVPLQAIILDYFDKLKSATSGYGSMSYEPMEYRAGDLVKLAILLLGDPAEALSTIVHRSEAHAVGAIVVARETLGAMRKDVTGYLYGGDVSRKQKLLKKQKKGKKRMKQMGKVTLTQEAFLSVLQRD